MMASVPYANENGVSPVGGSICLEHCWMFFDPFALSLVKALAQAVKDGMIAYFHLTITLWRRKEPMEDLVLGTEGGHFLVGEVRPVVGDDSVR